MEWHPKNGSVPSELRGCRYRQIVGPPCRVFYRFDGKRGWILHVMRSERLLQPALLRQRERKSQPGGTGYYKWRLDCCDQHSACSFILVHNHPSGIALPLKRIWASREVAKASKSSSSIWWITSSSVRPLRAGAAIPALKKAASLDEFS
jgi:hypothetical protein